MQHVPTVRLHSCSRGDALIKVNKSTFSYVETKRFVEDELSSLIVKKTTVTNNAIFIQRPSETETDAKSSQFQLSNECGGGNLRKFNF